MATVNVRRLDDDVVARLKRRAAANNRSLESEVRHILEGAARGDRDAARAAFRDLASRLRMRTASLPQTRSEELIREDRDSGHRS